MMLYTPKTEDIKSRVNEIENLTKSINAILDLDLPEDVKYKTINSIINSKIIFNDDILQCFSASLK